MNYYIFLFLIPGMFLIGVVVANLFRPKPRQETLPDYRRLSSEPRRYPGSSPAVGTGYTSPPYTPAPTPSYDSFVYVDSSSSYDGSSSGSSDGGGGCDSGGGGGDGGGGGGCD